MRRPGRPDLRRARLSPQQRRRAVPARAPGRPDLGGHERGAAADHRARARAPRRRGDDSLTDGGSEPSLPSRVDRGRRRHRSPRQLRRAGAAEPRRDRVCRSGLGREPGPDRGARAAVRAFDRRFAVRGGCRDRFGPGRGGRGSGGGGRRAGLRRRGRVQRRVRGVRRRGRVAARPSRGRGASWLARVRTELQRDRRDACAHRAVGRRAGAARARSGGADLAERQRRGERAGDASRPAVPHGGRERQPGGRFGRRLSGVLGGRGRYWGDRAVPRGRRRPGAVRRPGRVRREWGTRGGFESGQLRGGSPRRRGPQRRAGRRPADLPRADRGRRGRVGVRPPRAARARQDARGRFRASALAESRERARDHDLLGWRLRPGRRRGRAARGRAARARAGNVRPLARVAPRGRDGGEPARLHGDDLGRRGRLEWAGANGRR